MTLTQRLPALTVALLLAMGPSCGRDQRAPQSSEQVPDASAPAGAEAARVQAFAAAAVSFDRGDFLAAMNRLHQHYMAPEGLRRPNGLSIDGGPDFLGIAAWIFDVYL